MHDYSIYASHNSLFGCLIWDTSAMTPQDEDDKNHRYNSSYHNNYHYYSCYYGRGVVGSTRTFRWLCSRRTLWFAEKRDGY